MDARDIRSFKVDDRCSGSCWTSGLRMFAGGATASRTADDDEFMGTARNLFDDFGRAVRRPGDTQ